MAYTGYVDQTYYTDAYNGSTIPSADIAKKLIQASRHIDTLTFNRIVNVGFDNLTEFQQEIVKEAACRQADFEYENAELIESVLQSYSINGVSMEFGNGWNVKIENGVVMRKDLYQLLSQTGLCCRVM